MVGEHPLLPPFGQAGKEPRVWQTWVGPIGPGQVDDGDPAILATEEEIIAILASSQGRHVRAMEDVTHAALVHQLAAHCVSLALIEHRPPWRQPFGRVRTSPGHSPSNSAVDR